MGKSGGKKKKGAGSSVVNPIPNANGGAELDSSILLKRAHELKEEGNKKFQAKDYVGALEQYDNALRLTPKTHPDRAVFHSNRAACLMQMKPIDYETVIAECSMALQVQPQFVRALLRRARAFEAVGKYEMAMQDVQVLLAADPIQRDALEIARRLRTTLGSRPRPPFLSKLRGSMESNRQPLLSLYISLSLSLYQSQLLANSYFLGLFLAVFILETKTHFVVVQPERVFLFYLGVLLELIFSGK